MEDSGHKLKGLRADSIAITALLLIWASFHVEGVTSFKNTFGVFNTTLTDFLVVIFFFGTFFYLNKSFSLSKTYLLCLFTFLLILSSSSFSAFNSPVPFKGLTILLMLIRDGCLFTISYLLAKKINSERLFNGLIGIGFISGFVGFLFLFFIVLVNPQKYINHPGQWTHRFLFEIDYGRYIRFESLAGDSNFLALYLIMTFLLIIWKLVSSKAKMSPYLLGLLFLLAPALITTESRSVFSLYVVSTCALGIMVPTRGGGSSLKNYRKYQWRAIVGGLVVIIITFFISSYVRETIVALFERFTGNMVSVDPRWNLTAAQWEYFKQAPFIGNGLRYVFYKLDMYGHNSWLEILAECGIFGFMSWLLLYIVVFMVGFRKLSNRPYLLPLLQSWIILGGFLFFFSYQYHPFVWFLGGLITGLSSGRYDFQNTGSEGLT